MVSFPNAKINLGLSITEKRPDGFHTIESCFYPVQWCDVLEIIPSKSTVFTSSGIEIPGTPESNLCLKVYEALKKDFSIPSVHIHLLKNIPIGAGMGGGSSDAAFTIKTLNSLFHLNLSAAAMEEYVRPLGSDCAFFVNNQPVFAYEKGDKFRELKLALKGYHIVILYPPIHISTKEAYSGVVPVLPSLGVEEVLKKEIIDWKELLKNDFEDSLFPKYPVLREIKEMLYAKGAVYASMTGSGSAVYGLFKEERNFDIVIPTTYKSWKGILN